MLHPSWRRLSPCPAASPLVAPRWQSTRCCRHRQRRCCRVAAVAAPLRRALAWVALRWVAGGRTVAASAASAAGRQNGYACVPHPHCVRHRCMSRQQLPQCMALTPRRRPWHPLLRPCHPPPPQRPAADRTALMAPMARRQQSRVARHPHPRRQCLPRQAPRQTARLPRRPLSGRGGRRWRAVLAPPPPPPPPACRLAAVAGVCTAHLQRHHHSPCHLLRVSMAPTRQQQRLSRRLCQRLRLPQLQLLPLPRLLPLLLRQQPP